ncbi:MAG TPA: hypothetical protein VHS03_09215, partial [Gaiellaceae bacterium]|nr:hypothetical protein [Gaiellaceae bacterium]
MASNHIQVHTHAAVNAALRARQLHRPATVIRPPAGVRSGPAFALIVPMQFSVETHAPDSGPHVQSKSDDTVAG